MMSLRYWVLLLFLYVIYLLIGGFGFQALESPHECFRTMSERSYFMGYLNQVNLSRHDSETIYNFFVNRSRGSKETLGGLGGPSNMSKYLDTQKIETLNDTMKADLDCEKWDFYNSFVFVFTASTTIGYGQLSPVSWQGKLLCIFYSLIGIPINGILIGWLGSVFANKLEALRDYGDDFDMEDDPAKKKHGELYQIFSIILSGIVYLIPGIGVFVLIPAWIFHIVEKWSYFDSVYFAYITLTTIGFGDFAAGHNAEILKELNSWAIVYQIFILIWIILGLGYIFMIITIITDGIRKPVRKAVKKVERAFLKRIIQEIVEKQDMLYEMEKSRRESIAEPFDNDLSLEKETPIRQRRDTLDVPNQSSEEDEDPFDYNRDTIQSLQQFFEKNKKALDTSAPQRKRSSVMSSNKRFRRTVSMQHPPDMVVKSDSETVKKRRISSYLDEASVQRRSQASDRKSSISDMTFPQFLKNTTLEDFLAAANTVSDQRQSLHVEPSASTANSPQNTIHNGMRKLSNMASSSFEPFTKLFSGNASHNDNSKRNVPTVSEEHYREPSTRVVISSASSSSSSEREDEIRT